MPQVRDLVQLQEPQLERASPPLGPEHAGLEEPSVPARGPRALPPPEDVLVRQVEQQELERVPRAGVQPLSRRPLSRRVRIPRRFRRPLHPSGAA